MTPDARSARNYARSGPLVSLLWFGLFLSLPWLASCGGGTGTSSTGTGNTQLSLSGNLPTAQAGISYNATLAVSGGKAPYSFGLSSGTLPTGLSLNQTSGAISGTPANTGGFTFAVQAADSTGLQADHSFQITVADSTSVSVTINPDTVTIGSGDSTQFTALVSNTSNTTVTWSASSGSISSNGLYHAPTVTASTTATVTATSSADKTKTSTASVTILGPDSVAVTTTSLPTDISGTSYSTALKAAGGTLPYHWSLTSGTLPSGLTLQSGGTISGTTSQTGQFNVTVQVADSSSTPETATKSLTLTVATSSGGKTVTEFFFAADFNGSEVWPPTDGMGQSATLSGIRLWDDNVKWGQIESASGSYDWSKLDNWLDLAASANMDVLYTFGDTPQFAAASKPTTCGPTSPYSCAVPSDINSDGTGSDAYFQAFVTAVVTHAAGRISYYELWNEPDCNCFWAGNQAQLVRMGKDAAAIIRSLDPQAKILSPSAHGGTMKTWFDGYVAAGGAANFDIVNVHMRGSQGKNSNPEEFMNVWDDIQTELVARNLTTLPVWDDEHGILQGQGLTDPDELAGYVARSLVLRASVGIQRQYIYSWDSNAPYGLQASSSGTAWDQVAGWLIGHTVSACTVSGTVYTCPLDYGQVVWDTAQSCNKGVCTTSNYVFPQKYVWYRNMDGNKIALTGTTVPVGYQPILIEN